MKKLDTHIQTHTRIYLNKMNIYKKDPCSKIQPIK